MAPKSDMVAVRIEPELKDKLERHLAGLPGGVTLSQATRILIEWMEATRCDPATLMAETKAARLAAAPANGNGLPPGPDGLGARTGWGAAHSVASREASMSKKQRAWRG